MKKIKYDINLMKYMQLFENLTRAKLKDCILDSERLIFIVNENEIGRAIGRNGSNVKRLEGILKKRIKVVEFNNDVKQFIRNFLLPLQVKDVNEEENIVTIVGNDTKTRGLLIGRDSRNLDNLKNVIRRYFRVEDVRVV